MNTHEQNFLISVSKKDEENYRLYAEYCLILAMSCYLKISRLIF